MHRYPINAFGSYIWLSDGITAEAAESGIWDLVPVAAVEPQACSHILTLVAADVAWVSIHFPRAQAVSYRSQVPPLANSCQAHQQKK